MIVPGLVSVTFRSLDIGEVVDLAVQSDLVAIEWGGDVHVPHGDLGAAARARIATESAGLRVASYGSYHRFEDSSFDVVLETAIKLGAPLIRVWAGTQGSASVTEDQRALLAGRIQEAAEASKRLGIVLALEYHGGTLTDTVESSLRLMREVDHANARLLWQPDPLRAIEARLKDLRQVAPFVENVHVFQWTVSAGSVVRRPLIEGSAEWPGYLAVLSAMGGYRYALIEFVPNDDPACLPSESAVLRRWLGDLR